MLHIFTIVHGSQIIGGNVFSQKYILTETAIVPFSFLAEKGYQGTGFFG